MFDTGIAAVVRLEVTLLHTARGVAAPSRTSPAVEGR